MAQMTNGTDKNMSRNPPYADMGVKEYEACKIGELRSQNGTNDEVDGVGKKLSRDPPYTDMGVKEYEAHKIEELRSHNSDVKSSEAFVRGT